MNHFAKRLAAVLLLAALTVGAALPAGAVSLPKWPFRPKVESIDPGAYDAEMVVGTTQQLKPIVLPEDAAGAEVTFASEDISIIQVGGDGLIGAASVGSTRVSATAGDVTIYYDITVVPDPSTVVSDMDAALSTSTGSSELAVGEVANISVSVSPSSAAATATVTFTSSNEGVATVNNFGRVTAVGKGSATITVTCGEIVRTVPVTVYIPTDGIHLNTNYLVLKPGETARITGSVTPSTAPQGLTFRSSDKAVATVSGGGTVTAVGVGSTSIIVSNGDSSSMVTVIVNQGSGAGSSSSSDAGSGAGSSSGTEDASPADPILQQINDAQGELVNLHQADAPTITSEMLDALRRTGKTLSVTGADYVLTIDGGDIRNTQNTVDTAVTFAPSAEEDGLEFTLNPGGAMPCTVRLTLTGDNANYTRLYLYNEATGQWQYLNSYADGVITTDTAGRYLLTNETLTFVQMNVYALAAAGVVLLAIIAVYIAVKKRYWFW